MRDVDSRLTAIEGRLEAIERWVGLTRRDRQPEEKPVEVFETPRHEAKHAPEPSPAMEPSRPTPPAPTPRAQREAPHPTTGPARAAPRRDLERFLGVDVLGRVGIGAVLLAAAYFAQLAYREMGDLLKVLSLYALSGALVVVGHLVASRVAKRFVALLWGGAAAVAYIAGAAAYLRYGLVSPSVALLLLAAAGALAVVLARRLDHPALATVGVGGAILAPLLVAGPGDARTFLLVYALAIHAFAAWAERTWRWGAARLVAVGGVVIVAGWWVLGHGGLDLSTFVHLQAYAFGLLAPEIVDVIRQRRFAPWRQVAPWIVVGIFDLLLVVMAGSSGAKGLAGFGLAVGGTVLALAVALAGAARRGRNVPWLQAAAHVGGLLLVLGTTTLPRLLPPTGLEPSMVIALGCGALAVLTLALRRRVLAGEAAAAAAVVLAAAHVEVGPAAAARALALPAALAAAWVWWNARRDAPREIALGSALFAVLGAGIFHIEAAPGWAALALVVGAVLAAAAAVSAHRRPAPGGQPGAAVGLIGVAAAWAFLAFEGPLARVGVVPGVPGLDAMTSAAVAVAAVTGAVALFARGAPLFVRAAAGWSAAGVLALAGHREIVAAVADQAEAVRQAIHVLYVAFLATAGAVAARAIRREAVLVVAWVLLGGGLLLVLRDAGLRDRSAWAALELGAAVVGVLAVARIGRPIARQAAVLPLPLVLLAIAWGLYAGQGRLPADPLVFNLRALLGVGVLAVVVETARATPQGRLPGVVTCCGFVLAYLVGLLEVLDGARGLEGSLAAVFVSLYTALFSAAALTVGFRYRLPSLRYLALLGFGAVILKVGLHDLAASALPVRILVTGVLGLVLLASAFVYARTRTETTAE